MKTIVLFLLISLTISYRYNQKSQLHLSHKQKSQSRSRLSIRLKSMQKQKNKFLHHMRSRSNSRMKNQVTLKGMNLNQIDMKNRVNTKNGDIFLTQDNVPELYQECQSANPPKQNDKDESSDDVNLAFINFSERVKKGLQLLGDEYLRDYWLYFVQSSGKCDMKAQDASAMFMLMPEGDPRNIDFNNVNNRVGFIQVCINNEKSLIEKGQGLNFNLNEDSSGKSGRTRTTITDYVQKQYPPIVKMVGLNKEAEAEQTKQIQQREARIKQDEQRYLDLSNGPYLLKNCAFDTCSETPLYLDLDIIELDNNKKVRGNCQNEINDDESIVINNDNTDMNKFSVVNKNQVDSLGKLEQI